MAVRNLAPRLDAPGPDAETDVEDAAELRPGPSRPSGGTCGVPEHRGAQGRSDSNSGSFGTGSAAETGTPQGSPPASAKGMVSGSAAPPGTPAMPPGLRVIQPLSSVTPTFLTAAGISKPQAGAMGSQGNASAVARGPGLRSAVDLAPGLARRAPAPPLTEARAAALVVRGIAAVLRHHGGVVRLRLQPESLGEVTVRLELSGGSVRATIEAATARARQLLENASDSLRSALEAHGLSVERLEVRLSERAPEGGVNGPGAGSEQAAHGGADASGGDRSRGSEDPHAGSSRSAGDRLTDDEPGAAAEPIVMPEGVGVGVGGALVMVRLDTIA